MHDSEIARSLKENITLKKTIDRLSRNLNSFEESDANDYYKSLTTTEPIPY